MAMGLYHFFWEGKDRTVSINRLDKALISFMFLDDDISKKVNSHLLIETANGELKYRNEKEINSLDEASKLLSSIQMSVGYSTELAALKLNNG